MLVAELLLRESLSESLCENWCENLCELLRENLVTKNLRPNALCNFHHKNSANLRLCSGTFLGNERRRPKSEMLGFSQRGHALRRCRATMSAHASKPSDFFCFYLWCQGYFRNLFFKVCRWMGKTEPIMVPFAEDNASNRPRKTFDPKKFTGTLVGACWSRINREVQTVKWEAGKEGAAETGVKMGPEKAHIPWIRGKNGAQTVN